MAVQSRSGTIIDLIHEKTFPGTIYFENGKITGVVVDEKPKTTDYILPGFIDAHIHIESSMVIPSEFARLATPHGTVGTVSDPHEIGNVLGVEGVRYMIQNGTQVPFHFYFGAPSCVPATSFETAGAEISSSHIEKLFTEENLYYLAEMMNYPGVLHQDPEVMNKIRIAKSLHKPIDGHAPGLRGKDAADYIAAGISTDHECFAYEEALEKAKQGMHILIREGSAAKNYEALHPLFNVCPELLMFCSDDKHPHELIEGHINLLVKRSILDHGYELMDVLRAASLNPIRHYGLEIGLLRPKDSADFIVINNLTQFKVLETWIKGVLTAKDGKTLIHSLSAAPLNNFATDKKKVEDFAVPANSSRIRVIVPEDGQLITGEEHIDSKIIENKHVVDISRDILKLSVINRYQNAQPAVAFIKNFGLKHGAIASSVGHDSHNILAVGCSDEELCEAVNLVIENKGGVAVVSGKKKNILPLPVAGIMTNTDGYKAAEEYQKIDALAKELGTPLQAPFVTLSFMALLVIPKLKLSDKGLFDGEQFRFVPLELY